MKALLENRGIRRSNLISCVCPLNSKPPNSSKVKYISYDEKNCTTGTVFVLSTGRDTNPGEKINVKKFLVRD